MQSKIFLGAVACALLYMGSSILDNVTDKPKPIPEAKAGEDPSAPRKVDDNVIAFSTEDAALNAAKDKSRAPLPRFEQLWAEKRDGDYSVKFPMTQNGETEHIWLKVAAIEGETIVGQLANKPINGNQYHLGQTMTIEKSDVEDWMLMTDDGIYGGYAARVVMQASDDPKAKRMLTMFKD